MASRTQSNIDSIILNAKRNNFQKSMTYFGKVQVGIAEIAPLKRQLTLIKAAESPYATQEQKSLFCDFLIGENNSIAEASSLAMSNLLNSTL